MKPANSPCTSVVVIGLLSDQSILGISPRHSFVCCQQEPQVKDEFEVEGLKFKDFCEET